MELLKGVEMLIGIIKGHGTADHKREALAKETLELHRELTGIVTRGRRILNLIVSQSVYNQGEAVQLLSEQIGALRVVKDDLTTGIIGSVLSLHLPERKASTHTSTSNVTGL